MQKKVVGIIAGVATAHAVLLIGLMAGGGCRQPEILGPHTYNVGPELNEPQSVQQKQPEATPTTPPEIKQNDNYVKPLPPRPPKKVKPTPAPVKPGKDGVTVYTVQKGDVLSRIAARHGLRTGDLAAFNNIPKEKYGKLRIGQKLNIPAGGTYKPVKTASKPVVDKTAPQPAAADGVYVVKKGDTLGGIAQRHGVKVKALADLNKIPESKYTKIQIGQKLRIPGKAVDTSKTVTTTDSADNADTEIEFNDSTELETLQPSEDISIQDFCKKYYVESEEELRRYNPNLPADGVIKKGTNVKVPVM